MPEATISSSLRLASQLRSQVFRRRRRERRRVLLSRRWGNVFSGCRAWWNTDDGFDLIRPKVFAWSRTRGLSTTFPAGHFHLESNGSGFKAGGYGVPATMFPPRFRGTRAPLRCFRNKAADFTPITTHRRRLAQHSGYRNARDFDMLLLEGAIADHKLRNNFGYGSSSTLANFTGSDDGFNSWTTGVRFRTPIS